MQILDQFGQGGDLRLQGGDGIRGEFPDPILNRLQLAAQHRQRRAQLVGDIGHQVPAHLLVALKGAGQLVKIFGQTP